MRVIRPDVMLLWPSYTFFPLAGFAVLFIGVATGDPAITVIGIGLLAMNAATVVNHLYFTSVGVEGDSVVHRGAFGTRVERVPIGGLQRIDAKRYAGAHSGVSAPYFVARGRDSTVKVNTKPYRLSDFRALIATIRTANARVELDQFWERVAGGEDVSKEIALTPRSRS